MNELWHSGNQEEENDPLQEEENDSLESGANTWLSVGDLMSGLLMFFALLFITVMVQLKRYQDAFDDLPLVVKSAIEELGGEDTVSVDPETGDVSLDDSVFFDQGSAQLKPQGKEFLRSFIPVYSEVISSEGFFEDQIVRIIIEGRTSSGGSDEYNLELSLQRSLAVTEYILSDEVSFPSKENFEKKLLAAGRGEIDANQEFDDPSDRRVEFRFQLKRPNLDELLTGPSSQ